MVTIRFRQERRAPMYATLWYAYDGATCLGIVRKMPGNTWQGVCLPTYTRTHKMATRKAAAEAMREMR
jgi:hypothetical protein